MLYLSALYPRPLMEATTDSTSEATSDSIADATDSTGSTEHHTGKME